MASISKEKNGSRRILFVAPDGKRPTIRLGKVSQRMAEGIKYRVEQLLAAKLTGHAVDGDTARWVGELEPALALKLARVGLIPNPEAKAGETMTLGEFLAEFIASRPGLKPNTLKNYQQTRKSLVKFFGEDRVLTSITSGDGDDWQAKQAGEGYAPATISRNVKRAKQFFRAAVRRKLIAENPLADLKVSAQVNKTREYFVTREEAAQVLEACPDAEWRLIVALARYGGLRTPSETFALRWGDVNWEHNRFTVRSPKTEHHPGGESRIVPLFPELRPHLEAAFDAAPEGSEFVVTRHRLGGGANLRTQLLRIMDKAGVKPWPRLFQNMRASRETELTQSHPLHVVVAWIGNSAPIAAKHYLQVTDGDFERAVGLTGEGGAESGAPSAQNAAQQAHAGNRTDEHKTKQAPAGQGLVLQAATQCDILNTCSIPPRGVEPLSSD